MKRQRTLRGKSRFKFTKVVRQKGKISLSRFFQNFKEGDKVLLSVEPAIHHGMYDPKFMGKTGTIIRKNGKCYEVKIRDYAKDKVLIVHPVHLRRM